MNQEVYNKLEEFRQKGAAWQATERAKKMLEDLKGMLPAEEYTPLSIAHAHYRMGEGSAEFYDVIGKLISKYRQGPISGPAGKTLL